MGGSCSFSSKSSGVTKNVVRIDPNVRNSQINRNNNVKKIKKKLKIKN